MSKLYTYINSGSLKGKKLELPSLDSTRSTKSIVKGSFFDSYRYELVGKVFVEMFGGSGSMAAEALSNGASRAYAIEKDRDAFRILSQNFKSLDENLVAINGDSFTKIWDIFGGKDEYIIYIDPPFDIRDGFSDIYDRVIKTIENLAKFRIYLVTIEHDSKVKFAEEIGKFSLIKTKKFGKTSLTYYTKSSTEKGIDGEA